MTSTLTFLCNKTLCPIIYQTFQYFVMGICNKISYVSRNSDPPTTGLILGQQIIYDRKKHISIRVRTQVKSLDRLKVNKKIIMNIISVQNLRMKLTIIYYNNKNNCIKYSTAFYLQHLVTLISRITWVFFNLHN